MSRLSTSPDSSIHVITNPTDSQILRLWESRLSNPEEIAYSFADASPTLDEFIEGLNKEEILCLIAENDCGEFLVAG